MLLQGQMLHPASGWMQQQTTQRQECKTAACQAQDTGLHYETRLHTWGRQVAAINSCMPNRVRQREQHCSGWRSLAAPQWRGQASPSHRMPTRGMHANAAPLASDFVLLLLARLMASTTHLLGKYSIGNTPAGQRTQVEVNG